MVVTGKQTAEFDSGHGRIWNVAWSPDGSLLASCGEDRAVRIWKREGSSLSLATTLNDSHTRSVRSVAFSHDGRSLASAAFDSSVVVYRREDGGEFEEANKLEGHENEVKGVAWSPSDEFLATCSRDKTVWVWQQDEDDDFQVSSVLQSHTADVKFVTWSPVEDLLVSCSYDASIRFYRYDGSDWETVQVGFTTWAFPNDNEGTVWAVAFSPDGRRLATVGEDHTVRLYHQTGGKWAREASHAVEDTRWPFYSLSWSRHNDLIAVGGGDSRIRFFSLQDDAQSACVVPEGVLKIHEDEVNAVAWHPQESGLLASAGDDGFIRLANITL